MHREVPKNSIAIEFFVDPRFCNFGIAENKIGRGKTVGAGVVTKINK